MLTLVIEVDKEFSGALPLSLHPESEAELKPLPTTTEHDLPGQLSVAAGTLTTSVSENFSLLAKDLDVQLESSISEADLLASRSVMMASSEQQPESSRPGTLSSEGNEGESQPSTTAEALLATEMSPTEMAALRKDSEATLVGGGSALGLTPSPDVGHSEEKSSEQAEPELKSSEQSKDKLPFSDIESAEKVGEVQEEQATITVAKSEDTESVAPKTSQFDDLQVDKNDVANVEEDTEVKDVLLASKESTTVESAPHDDNDDKIAENSNVAEQQLFESSTDMKSEDKEVEIKGISEKEGAVVSETSSQKDEISFAEMETKSKTESESKDDSNVLSLAQELIDAAKTELVTSSHKSPLDDQILTTGEKEKIEPEKDIEVSIIDDKNEHKIDDKLDKKVSPESETIAENDANLNEILSKNDKVQKSAKTDADANIQEAPNADTIPPELDTLVKLSESEIAIETETTSTDNAKTVGDITGVPTKTLVTEADLTETVAKIESELPDSSKEKGSEVAVESPLSEAVISTEKAVIADDKAANDSTTGDDNGDTQLDNRDKQVPVDEEFMEDKKDITVLRSSELTENDAENAVIEQEELKKDLQSEEILKPDTTTGDGDKIAQEEELNAKDSTVDSQTVDDETTKVDKMVEKEDATISKSADQESEKEDEQLSEPAKKLSNSDYFDKVVAEKETSLSETQVEIEDKDKKPENGAPPRPTSAVTEMLEAIPSKPTAVLSTDYFDRLVEEKKVSETPIGATVVETKNKNDQQDEESNENVSFLELDNGVSTTTSNKAEESFSENLQIEKEVVVSTAETLTETNAEPVEKSGDSDTGVLDRFQADDLVVKEETPLTESTVETTENAISIKSNDDILEKDIKNEQKLLVDQFTTSDKKIEISLPTEEKDDKGVVSPKIEKEFNVTAAATTTAESTFFADDDNVCDINDQNNEASLTGKIEIDTTSVTEKQKNEFETNLENEPPASPITQKDALKSGNAQTTSPLFAADVLTADFSTDSQLIENKKEESNKEEAVSTSAVVDFDQDAAKSSNDLQNATITDSIVVSEPIKDDNDNNERKNIIETDNQINVVDQTPFDIKLEEDHPMLASSLTDELQNSLSTVTSATSVAKTVQVENENEKIVSSDVDFQQAEPNSTDKLAKTQILASVDDQFEHDDKSKNKTDTSTTPVSEAVQQTAEKSPAAETLTPTLPSDDQQQSDSFNEVVTKPDSEKEDSVVAADEQAQQVSSPLEIIDESQILENSPPATSPLVQTPVSSTSADDLTPSVKTEPELVPQSPIITEISSESRKESTVSLGDFDLEHRATQQTLDAENIAVDKRSRKSVDFAMDNSGKTLKTVDMPPLTRRSDSDFDRAFLASADIDPDDDYPPTSGDESNDDLVKIITAEASQQLLKDSDESDSLQKTPTSKLEVYFTSDLVKPLEKVAEETKSIDHSDGFKLTDKDDIKSSFEFVEPEDIGDADVDENKNHLVSTQKSLSEEKAEMLKEAIFETDDSKLLQPIETELSVQSVTTEPTVEASKPVDDNAEKLSTDSFATKTAIDISKNIEFENETQLTNSDAKSKTETNKFDTTTSKSDLTVKTESNEHNNESKNVISSIDNDKTSKLLSEMSGKTSDESLDTKAEKPDSESVEKFASFLVEKESSSEMIPSTKTVELKDDSKLSSNTDQLLTGVTEKNGQYSKLDVKTESTENAGKTVDFIKDKSNNFEGNQLAVESVLPITATESSNENKTITSTTTVANTVASLEQHSSSESSTDEHSQVQTEKHVSVTDKTAEDTVDAGKKLHADNELLNLSEVKNEFNKTSSEHSNLNADEHKKASNAENVKIEQVQESNPSKVLDEVSPSDENYDVVDKSITQTKTSIKSEFKAVSVSENKADDDIGPVSPLVKADFTAEVFSKSDVDDATDDGDSQSSHETANKKSSVGQLEIFSISETSIPDLQSLNSQTDVTTTDKIDSITISESDLKDKEKSTETSVTNKTENQQPLSSEVVPSTVDLQALLGICDVESDENKQKQSSSKDVDNSHSTMASTEKMFLNTSTPTTETFSDLNKDFFLMKSSHTENETIRKIQVNEVDAEKTAQILAKSSDHLVMKQEEQTAFTKKLPISKPETTEIVESFATITETDRADVILNEKSEKVENISSAIASKSENENSNVNGHQTSEIPINDVENQSKLDEKPHTADVSVDLETFQSSASQLKPFEDDEIAVNTKTSQDHFESIVEKGETTPSSESLITITSNNKNETVADKVELEKTENAAELKLEKNDESSSAKTVDIVDDYKSKDNQADLELSSLSSIDHQKDGNQTNVKEGKEDIEELEPISIPEPYEIATAIIELVNGKVTAMQQSEKLAEINRQEELEIIEQIKSKSSDVKEVLASEKEAMQKENAGEEVPFEVDESSITQKHQDTKLQGLSK